MVKRFTVVLSLALIAAFLMSLPQQAAAGVLAQALYQTPTPGPDGRIIYVVKAGETCLSISLMTGVSLEQLRSLNNLKAECVIRPGQQLLLGLAGPVDATPTPGPAPTATPVLPSATPFIGTGEICIVTFEDVNGNSVRDDGENVIPDSAISVSNRSGKVSLTGVTTAADAPVCFREVLEGEYNISVAVPQGYNPTTVTNYTLQLKAGDQVQLDFGAQVSQKSAPPPTMTTPLSTGGETQSPLLGFIGVLLLLVGGGLGVYVWRMKKS
jgi:LPXTG-motif cell wall-anchored protein